MSEMAIDLTCDERLSDSPYIQRVWYSRSDDAAEFVSMAQPNWEMVVTRVQGKTYLTIRGPETKATPAYCPPDAEFWGIQFQPGTFMPDFPAKMVMDRQDVNLPDASSQSFWLKGSAWPYPTFDNADTFVERLVRDDLLVHDPVVSAVLCGEPVAMSLRTVQRRFIEATGLTHNAIYQINRARYAIRLLKRGDSILDAVYKAGYADQPHLTRTLKRLTGQTPAHIISEGNRDPLSLLFNTTPF